MAEAMTDKRLAEIAARADAATGAWNAATAPNDPTEETKQDYVLSAFHPDQADEPLWVVWAANADNLTDADYVVVAVTGDGPRSKAHAEFIAAARTDVPALLAEVERLRPFEAAVARVEAVCAALEAQPEPRRMSREDDRPDRWDARQFVVEQIRAALATPPTSPVSDGSDTHEGDDRG